MLPTDSKTSSSPDSSPPASLTAEASKTCAPATSKASSSAISSPASASGPLRFVEPDGQMTDLFGPVPVRANLSARQAKALDLMTSGTFGRTSSTSSASAALQSSLVSRLQARTRSNGSTLYVMTWKAWALPSGRSLSRLRASVRRTSGTAPTGWPTPGAGDAKQSSNVDRWHERAAEKSAQGIHLHQHLTITADLASWATPSARDWHSASASPEFLAQRAQRAQRAQGKPLSEQAFTLAAWPTPRAADGEKNVRTAEGSLSEIERKGSPQDLCMAAAIAGPARLTVSGEMLTGLDAAMDAGGQLSPAHSRWLMGCRAEWDRCSRNFDAWQSWQDWIGGLSPEQRRSVSAVSEATATPSTPSRRESSSKQPCEA